MECKDLKELLFDYYDGSLSSFKKEAVVKHLLSCKRCDLAYSTLKEALNYIKSVPDEELPGEFYSGLDKILDEACTPFYKKYRTFLNLRNMAAGTLGVLAGVIIGVFVSSYSSDKDLMLSFGSAGQTAEDKVKSSSLAGKKTANKMVMKTADIYKASYDLDRIVGGFEGTATESVLSRLPENPSARNAPVLHKKYIITVNAGQYENLIKQLNGLGYIMKLPDKKELAELKKLTPRDNIKFELDITEDGK